MSLRSPKASINLSPEGIRQILIDHDSVLSYHFSTQSGAYTTSGAVGHEYVLTSGSSPQTISLHASPQEGQRVTVKRGGTGAVTVDTAGAETIDGGASVSLVTQYDTQTYLCIAGQYYVVAEMVN